MVTRRHRLEPGVPVRPARWGRPGGEGGRRGGRGADRVPGNQQRMIIISFSE